MSRILAALILTKLSDQTSSPDVLCGDEALTVECTAISSRDPSPFIVMDTKPVTTPVPRHKSTHPADVQDRRRKRKQKL